jgi:hypothetical protein
LIVRYAPEGAEPQQWTFRPGELESHEAEAIEEVGGAAWASYFEFGQKILNGSAKAQRAILWTMLRRAQPKLRFDEVSYRQDEVFVGYEPAEVVNLRAALAAPDTEIPDDQRAALLEAIDLATYEADMPVADAGEATPETAEPAGTPGKDTAPAGANVSGT